MGYQKQNWEDLPSRNTPVTASKMLHIEDGIEEAYNHGGAGDVLKVGAIIPFSGSTAPNGYMICDGSAISRTTYAELFSVIGTTFGEGDGSTTFNIPNLKGRTTVGYDSSQTEFDSLGETGGEKTHTLTVNEMPAHTHNYTTSEVNNYVKIEASTAFGRSANVTYPSGSTGGDQPHNNLQPYIVINYIIKATEAQTGDVLSESLPVGTELDYDGETVPTGWQEITDPNSYSTSEVKTDKTWIDGKPIYRKVFNIPISTFGTGTSAVGVNIIYNHNISNYDKCISCNTFWLDNNGELLRTRFIPANYFATLDWATQSYVSSSYISFELGKEAINRIRTYCEYFYTILEYTKTTDGGNS